MKSRTPRSSATSFAVLGQVALRDVSAYELARESHRNLRFFWPRAESHVYAEVKRLAAGRLVRATRTKSGGRAKTTYRVTADGRSELAAWLATPLESPPTFEIEALVRLILAPLGRVEDLAATLEKTEADAAAYVAFAEKIAVEYLAGNAPFQHHVHARALLFEALYRLFKALETWVVHARAEVARWRDPEGDIAAQRRALERIAAVLAELGRGGGDTVS